jgi:hypothetical protein
VARSPDRDTNHEPTPASAPAFFPTPDSVVTPSTPTTSPPSTDHFSPHFQNSGHFGEHCTPNSPTPAIQPREKETSQPLATSQLATLTVTSSTNDTPAIPPSIFPHEPSTPGEICIPGPTTLVGWDQATPVADGPPTPATDVVPPRPLRCGRKPALDDIAKGRLLGLLAYGLSFRQAAAHVGIDHKTILNTIQRDPDFAAQVSEARLDAISQPLLTIIKASRTDWRAAAWLARFLNERRVSLNEVTVEERELRHSHYCE